MVIPSLKDKVSPEEWQLRVDQDGDRLSDSPFPLNPAILQGVAHAMKVQTGSLGGRFVWPALIRKLDRTDTSYKT